MFQANAIFYVDLGDLGFLRDGHAGQNTTQQSKHVKQKKLMVHLTKDRFGWIILNYVILSALDVNKISCLQVWSGTDITF